MFSAAQVIALDPPTKKHKASKESFGYEIPSDTYQKAVYQSDDGTKVFIDFNEIPVNLKSIQVLNSNGDIFVNKVVFELPVNSLFEIDSTEFPGADLVLEIQTFTDSRFVLLGSR